MKKILTFLLICIPCSFFASHDDDSYFVQPSPIPKQDSFFNPGQSLIDAAREVGSYTFGSVHNADSGFLSGLRAGVSALGIVASGLGNVSAACNGDTKSSISQLAREGKLIAAKTFYDSMDRHNHQQAIAAGADEKFDGFYKKITEEIARNIQEMKCSYKRAQEELAQVEKIKRDSYQNQLSEFYAIFEGLDKSQEVISKRDWYALIPEVRDILQLIDISYQQQLERTIEEARSFMAARLEIEKALDRIEVKPTLKLKDENPELVAAVARLKNSIQTCQSQEDVVMLEAYIYDLYSQLAKKRYQLLLQRHAK